LLSDFEFGGEILGKLHWVKLLLFEKQCRFRNRIFSPDGSGYPFCFSLKQKDSSVQLE
jgi:hypothetical protein